MRFTQPGLYTVRLTISNKCGNYFKDTIITIKGPPDVTLPSSKSYCNGQTISFDSSNISHRPIYNANQGTISAYQWSISPNGASFISGTDSSYRNPVIQFPAATSSNVTYTVRVIVYNQCGSDTAIQQVTIFPTVLAPTVRDTFSCGSASFLLSGIRGLNGKTLRWYNDSTNLLSTSLTYNTGTINSTDTFFVSSYDTITGCESIRVPLKIVIYPIPSQPSDSSRVRCGPSSVSFSPTIGNNGNNLKWYSTSSSTTPIYIGSTFTTPLLTATTTYYVSSFDSIIGCEGSRLPITITINNLPSVFAGNDTSFCNQNTNINLINFSPSGGTWSGAGVTGSGVFNPATAGVGTHSLVYAVASGTNGCIGRDTVVITVVGLTQANAGSDTSVCRNSGTFTKIGAPAGGSWTGSTHITTSGVFTPSTAGTFSVIYSIGTGTCLSRDTATVTVHSLPIPSFSAPVAVCPLQVLNLTGSVSNSVTVSSYRWFIANTKSFSNAIINDSSVQSPVLTFPDNQSSDTALYTLKLIVQTTNGCIDSLSRQVILNKRPAVSFSLSNAKCGPATLSVTNNTTNSPSGWSWTVSPSTGTSITTSTSITPSISLPINISSDSINYTIRLIASLSANSITCRDTGNALVTIYPRPVVSFTAIPDTGCTPLTVSFTNTSNPRNNESRSSMSFQWALNVSQISTDSVLSNQTFTNPLQKDSILSVRLIGTTKHGCIDSMSKNITVYPRPKSLFSSSLTSSCAPFIINSSVISLTTFPLANDFYSWRILNGTGSSVRKTSTGTSIPADTLTNSSDSLIYELVTSNVHGCTQDTLRMTFRTIANPTPGFTMSDSLGCTPLTVNFTNTSTAGVSLNWTFSNGQTSTSATPSVTFNNTSNTADTIYRAKLLITAGSGCRDSIEKVIRVFPRPRSIFAIPLTNLCPNDSVTLTNTSIHKGATATFRWNVNAVNTVTVSDSTIASPRLRLPENKSTSDSTFTLRLRTTSVDGCVHDTARTATLLRRPNAQFTIPPTACGPFTFTPTNNTNNIPTAQLNWLWTVIPSTSVSITTGTSISPSITLPQNSTNDSINYTVKLRSTRTAQGCVDSSTRELTVYPRPQANFTMSPDTGCTPLTVTFSNTSNAKNGESRNTMNFIWRLNGSTISTDSVLANQTFTNALQKDSVLTVRLIGTSKHGCLDTTDKNITVYPRPKSLFTASSTTSCAPFIINSSIISLTQYPLSIDTYSWRILNGTGNTVRKTATGISIPADTISGPLDSLIYELVTSNVHGCTLDTLRITFRTIASATPTFTMSDSLGCSPKSIQFTNTSPTGVSIRWTISNGYSDTIQNPSIVFNNLSNSVDTSYRVKLLITAGSGCKDSLERIVRIYPIPRSVFSIPLTNLCPNDTVSLTNTSIFKGSTRTSKWLIQGVSTLSLSDSTVNVPQLYLPENKSTSDSTFTLRLRTTSLDGCVHDTTRTATLLRRPNAQFTIPPTACGPFTFTPTNNTNNIPSAQLSWLWTVTPSTSVNITTSTSISPSITLPLNTTNDSINYRVRLKSTRNTVGCIDSSDRVLTIYPKPDVDFSISPILGCTPLNVNFSNTTNPKNGELRSTMFFNWYINGDSVSVDSILSPKTFVNPLLKDSILGISLLGVTKHGCRDTAIKSLTIYPKPKSDFTASNTTSCAPFIINSSVITLVPHLQTNDSFYWRILNASNGSLRKTSTGTVIPVDTLTSSSDSLIYELVTANVHGCTRDTLRMTFRTIANPTPGFTMSDSLGCTALTVNFTNTSSTGVSLSWTFSNGQTSTSATPSVTFNNTSNTLDTIYRAKLVITAGSGCKDSLQKNIRVYPRPRSVFSIPLTNLCPNDTVSLTNTSIFKGSTRTSRWLIQGVSTLSLSDSTVNVPQLYLPENKSTSDSTFTLRLRTTSVDGCVHDTTRTATLLRRPNAQFTIPPTACGPFTFTPTNNTNNIPTAQLNWLWTVIPSTSVSITTGTSISPSITLPQNSTNDSINYTVKLRSTRTAQGCVDSSTRVLTVYPRPQANFTMSPDTGCTPLTVTFSNTSNAKNGESRNTMNFIWRLNGSTISTDSILTNQTFTNALQKDSVLTVRLIGTSKHGCLDTTDKNITVYPRPKSLFTASSTTSCAPFIINSSIISLTQYPLSNDTYSWRILNGTGSSVRKTATGISIPADTISGPLDSLIYELVTSNVHGCTQDTLRMTFRTIANPTPGFTMSDSLGCTPLAVNFTNTSTAGVSLNWTFSNGQTSTSATPSVTFNNTSNTTDTIYRAKLLITAGSGCRDSIEKVIRVFPRPRSIFAIPLTNLCPNDSVTLTNTSIHKGATATFRWNVNAVNTVTVSDSTIASPRLRLPENKSTSDSTFTLRLRTTSLDGCVHDTARTATLLRRPNAQFTIPPAACGPFTFTPTNNTNNIPTAQLNWLWTVIPSTSVSITTGTSISPSITLPQNSTNDSINYTVKLRSTRTAQGCVDSSTRVLTVYPRPQANFTMSPDTGCTPLTVTFSNTSNAKNGESRNTMSFIWRLNGSTISTDSVLANQTFTNALQKDSVLTVRLIGTSKHGCLDTTDKNITVYPRPKSLFTASSTTSCAPFSINSSIISLTPHLQTNDSFYWRILNGTGTSVRKTSTGMSIPADTLSTPSDSLIYELVTANVHGCTRDTLRMTFRTIANPTPGFTMSDSLGCTALTVNFTNTSSTGVSLSWTFSNGQTSTSATPSVTFNNTSNTLDTIYRAKLVITAGSGCKDSLQKNIRVYPRPRSVFSIPLTNLCPNDTVSLTNTSIFKGSTRTSRWLIQGVSTLSLSDSTVNLPQLYLPENKSTSDSTFTLRLRTTSVDGCVHDTTRTAILLRRPNAQFTIPPTACGPFTFTPTNNTNNIPTAQLNWLWTVIPSTSVSITTGTSISPSITLPQNSTNDSINYTVKLRSTRTAQGCVDSSTRLLTVYPRPQANFTMSPDTGCTPLTVTFSNSSNAKNGESRNTMSFIWRLNGSTISTDSVLTNQTFTNALQKDSVLTVRLIGTSKHGCLDTTDKNITVYPRPKSLFTASSTTSCAPFIINSSIISLTQYPLSNDTYSWRILNGTGSSVRKTATGISIPADTISGPLDSLIYELVTSNVHGCTQDTLRMTFRTIANPIPGFTMSDTVKCSPFTINLINTSTPANSITHFWRAGSLTSTNTNPSFSFSNFGVNDTTVRIRLIITSTISGCKDSIEKFVVVKPLPRPNLSFSDSAYCFPIPISVQNTSTAPPTLNPAGYNWSISGFGITQIINDTTSGGTTILYPDNQSGITRTYLVKLKATSSFGCIDSIIKPILIPTRPRALFNLSNDSICSYLSINTNNISLYATGYEWKSTSSVIFGTKDSINTSLRYPLLRGLVDSIYNIRLIAINNFGCKDSINKPLKTFPKPIALFTPDTNAGCSPLTVRFNNSSVSKPVSAYLWRLENAVNDSNTSPIHTFNGSPFTDTTYQIRLIATSKDGCKDTILSNVLVKARATAKISVPDSVYCMNSFNAGVVPISNLSFGEVDTFYYDFGDNTSLITTSDTTVSHHFTSEGYFKIRVTAKNICRTSTDSVVIKILRTPLTSFTLSDTAGCGPLVVKFNNNTPSFEATYNWSFGNGQSSTNKHPDSVIYTQSKFADTTYVIRLTASNLCGTRTMYDTIRVLPTPVASFLLSPDSGCAPLSVSFLNTTTGWPTSVRWVFGNGDSSTRFNPYMEVFTTEDTATLYKIRLVASNQCGHDTTYRNLKVFPNSVRSFFTTSGNSGCAPFTVKFFNKSVGGKNVSWNFGNGNTSTLDSPEVVFSTPGIYNVKLFVNNGCSYDTSFVNISVFKSPDFSISKNKPVECSGQPIQFNSQILDSGAIVWYFGNGDSSTLFNPLYTYSTPGLKPVTVRLSSFVNNCPTIKHDTVRINPIPNITLTVNDSSACVYETFRFNALGSTAQFYTWNFGDNNSNSGIQVNHTYASDGNYTVKLIAETSLGCKDSTEIGILVYPKPNALFNYSPIDTCNGPVKVNFTNNSTGANTYNWTFGNGDNSNLLNPSTTYNTVGAYPVRLIVLNQYSCFDTASKIYHVYNIPQADFSASVYNGCEPLNVQFNNTSINASTYMWDFGDGSFSIDKQPNHYYSTPGKYFVKMIATEGGMCRDTAFIIDSIVVYPLPTADFDWYVDTLQAFKPFLTVNFINQSVDANKYFWYFGDGSNINPNENPVHRFPFSGDYSTTLIVKSTDGCLDTLTKQISIPEYKKGLYVPNAFTPDYGQEDVRTFKPSGIELRTYYLKIYNKWGELIWETDELTEKGEPKVGWNGIDNRGRVCPQGSYVWVIEATFTDGTNWTGMVYPKGNQKPVTAGNVTLIR
jgi:PKD repeat protein